MRVLSWIKSVATKYKEREGTTKNNTASIAIDNDEHTEDTSNFANTMNKYERENIGVTEMSGKHSKTHGNFPSLGNCISDQNNFCKTHRRLGKMVDITKKDIKLDENSKKFEVKSSTTKEFTCNVKTKASVAPRFTTSLSSANLLDCTESAVMDDRVNNGRKLSRTLSVVELRRCYERPETSPIVSPSNRRFSSN